MCTCPEGDILPNLGIIPSSLELHLHHKYIHDFIIIIGSMAEKEVDINPLNLSNLS